MKTGELTRDN